MTANIRLGPHTDGAMRKMLSMGVKSRPSSTHLVGQETVGDVARGQGNRRLQRAEVVDALVVPLVALLQPLPPPEYAKVSTQLATGVNSLFSSVPLVCPQLRIAPARDSFKQLNRLHCIQRHSLHHRDQNGALTT